MDKFLLRQVIEFEDGEYEINILHAGTEDECQRLFNSRPFIVYRGSKKFKTCTMEIVQINPEVKDE